MTGIREAVLCAAIALSCRADRPAPLRAQAKETAERRAGAVESQKVESSAQRLAESNGRSYRPGRPVAASPCDKEVDARQALAAAQAWLEAMKSGDGAQMAQHTRFPFRYDTTDRKKSCDGIVAESRGLQEWLACLARKDELLVKEVSHAESPNLQLEVVTLDGTPQALRRLVGKPGKGAQLVSTYINGDGITFEFVIVVCGAHGAERALVSAFLVNAEVVL